MIRRTLALSGVAILATAGLAGPAAADSSIAAVPVLHMQEAGIELDTMTGVLEIDGDVVEIKNPTGGLLSLNLYTLEACNATTGLTPLVTDFEANDQIAAGGVFLVGNTDYRDTDGPAPQRLFEASVDQFLSQDDGGIELVDTATGDVQNFKWGTPHSDCVGFTGAPTPTPSQTLNYNLGTGIWTLGNESLGS